MTGVEIKKYIGLAKFGSALYPVCHHVIPAFLGRFHMTSQWQPFSWNHRGGAPLPHQGQPEEFYSPGMLTALFVQFPVAAFGYYYLIANGMIRESTGFMQPFSFLVPCSGFIPSLYAQWGEVV